MKPKATNKTKPTKALTPNQKRVAIAKDVLAQVAAKKYDVQVGSFIQLLDGNYPEASGKRELCKPYVKCEVCAVGAAIVSGIRLFNNLTILDGEIDNVEAWDMVREFFSPEQAMLIENAFELGHGSFDGGPEDEWNREFPEIDTDAAIHFGERYEDKNERCVAIFTNIIANKGIFKP